MKSGFCVPPKTSVVSVFEDERKNANPIPNVKNSKAYACPSDPRKVKFRNIGGSWFSGWDNDATRPIGAPKELDNETMSYGYNEPMPYSYPMLATIQKPAETLLVSDNINALSSCPIQPFIDFPSAAKAVPSYLYPRIGFDLWLVTRVEGDDKSSSNPTTEAMGYPKGPYSAGRIPFVSTWLPEPARILPRLLRIFRCIAIPAGRGVPSRRGCDHLVGAEEERCRRYEHLANVVAVDLDGLKHINETEGHATRDARITRAANALRDVVRGSHVVARIGGDALRPIRCNRRYRLDDPHA